MDEAKLVQVPLDVLQELYENSLDRMSELDYRRGYDRYKEQMARADEAHGKAKEIIAQAYAEEGIILGDKQ